jgi:hypothetical protein
MPGRLSRWWRRSLPPSSSCWRPAPYGARLGAQPRFARRRLGGRSSRLCHGRPGRRCILGTSHRPRRSHRQQYPPAGRCAGSIATRCSGSSRELSSGVEEQDLGHRLQPAAGVGGQGQFGGSKPKTVTRAFRRGRRTRDAVANSGTRVASCVVACRPPGPASTAGSSECSTPGPSGHQQPVSIDARTGRLLRQPDPTSRTRRRRDLP